MEYQKRRKIVLNEKGTTMIEYALLAALIAVVCIAGVRSLGWEARDTFIDSANAIGGTGG